MTKGRLLRRGTGVLIFVAMMTLSAQVAVPMVPVPMTLQSLVVCLTGLMLGPFLGAVSVLIYLGLAALGLPILAEGGFGVEAFYGPTAGYLWAFPFAAAWVGWASRQPRLSSHTAVFCMMLAAHALILIMGATWLSLELGAYQAYLKGVQPFLIGTVVKSAIALSMCMIYQRIFRRSPATAL